MADALWTTPRAGRRIALFTVRDCRAHGGHRHRFCRVMRVAERAIDKRGQPLPAPEIELKAWWTSFWFDEGTIIALHTVHGTSQQFHSKLKTTLDIERLP